jgi:hypothetical protein
MYNVIFTAKLTEFGLELRPSISPDGDGPAQSIKPVLQDLGHSPGCQSLKSLIYGVPAPLINTDQEGLTRESEKI